MSLGIDIAVLVADTNDRPALVKPTGERIPHGYRLATVAVYEAVETVAADQSPASAQRPHIVVPTAVDPPHPIAVDQAEPIAEAHDGQPLAERPRILIDRRQEKPSLFQIGIAENAGYCRSGD